LFTDKEREIVTERLKECGFEKQFLKRSNRGRGD